MASINEQLVEFLRWDGPGPIWDPATLMKSLNVINENTKTRINIAYLDLQKANLQNQITFVDQVQELIKSSERY